MRIQLTNSRVENVTKKFTTATGCYSCYSNTAGPCSLCSGAQRTIAMDEALQDCLVLLFGLGPSQRVDRYATLPPMGGRFIDGCTPIDVSGSSSIFVSGTDRAREFENLPICWIALRYIRCF